MDKGDQQGLRGLSRTSDGRKRKVFARASVDSRRTYLSGAAIQHVIAQDFVTGLRMRCGAILDADRELLRELFFVGGNSNYTSLLPSDDHPGKPLRSWQPFYELEMDAAQTYLCRFFPNTHFYPVNSYPRLRSDDDVVIIGSQVSNRAARVLLGSANRKEPVFQIVYGNWRTNLHWNLLSPENAPRTKIREFGGQRYSLGHVVYERDNPVPYQSRTDLARTRYLDDYLLVTMIPRQKDKPQRVLILAGLHGAGARCIDLILRDPPRDLLQEAARQIASARWYQILLRLSTVPDTRGESLPCKPELIGARPLIIE